MFLQRANALAEETAAQARRFIGPEWRSILEESDVWAMAFDFAG